MSPPSSAVSESEEAAQREYCKLVGTLEQVRDVTTPAHAIPARPSRYENESSGATSTAMNLDENPHENYNETHGQNIPPREEEPRSPRLAEKEYEDPHSNRESHSLKRRRANLHERELRGFEEASERLRDRREEEYFREMEYVFGLYEEGVRAWKEQQEQSPIDTREFTNENPGEPLPPLTPPESPLGDHPRE